MPDKTSCPNREARRFPRVALLPSAGVTTTSRGGLLRDLDLLRALAALPLEATGLGVMALAAAVDRDKSQVSRAMRALESVGLVERDPSTREYRLGSEFFTLAARAGPNRLLQTAPHYLQALAQQLDETVHLCVLAGTGVVTAASAPAISHRFRMGGWEGEIVPAHCTSAGRVLLCDADFAFIEQRFSDVVFEPAGPRSRVHGPFDLWDAIIEARTRGYAVVDQEFETDLVGVSAPIRDHHGRIVAAINISARASVTADGVTVPAGQQQVRLHELGRVCRQAAVELSTALGCPEDRGRPTGPS